ncbi:hypothetical protein ABPG72_004870 [Tetrahymena utriculariae]
MNNSHFSNVVDPRYSSSSSSGPQQYFTQSVSQFIPRSNNQSQDVQNQQINLSEPLPGQSNQQFVTSIVYQQPVQTNTYTTTLNYGNVSNPLQSQYVSDTSNIQNVIESVKRSAALRQSQQQQQSQLQQPQVLEPQKFGNSTLVSSQYVQYDSNLNASFNPNKQQQSSSLQQPSQHVNYLSQSQSGLVNSTNLSVPSFSGAGGMGYYQTPDRSVQIKQDSNAHIKFLTPNKSPSACKIVQRSPTKQQIDREIDIQNQIAQQEYLACQNSVNSLKNNIEFINATNASPDKRHTAKSIVTKMGAPLN